MSSEGANQSKKVRRLFVPPQGRRDDGRLGGECPANKHGRVDTAAFQFGWVVVNGHDRGGHCWHTIMTG